MNPGSESLPPDGQAMVVAVCVSPGGIPKRPVPFANLLDESLESDGHTHDKHNHPKRAVSLLDEEILRELTREGFELGPGIMGENLTVRHLRVQGLTPGDRLCFANGPVLELTEPRKPCFVLDAVDPRLKEAAVGRCGYMARVVEKGRFFPGQSIRVLRRAAGVAPS